jgi:branched-chain amino acid transport system ATP-binding protein
MTAAVLEVEGVTRRFGGLAAVDDVSFGIPPGIVKGIIGPNGAGKTTLFNLIAGVSRPDGGRIRYDGTDITPLEPYRRVRLGIARTFQNLQIFRGMTVVENVMVGAHARGSAGFVSALLKLSGGRRQERAIEQCAREALAAVGLEARADDPADALSFGEAKILEIARAVAAEPRLLLLDEPTAGLPHAEAQRIGNVVRGLVARGITVCLVEHNMRLVMSLCDDILVLNHGARIAEGTADEVRQDPVVLEAYLGRDDGFARD